MTDGKHPWVEDYTDYEAVLKCVNEPTNFNNSDADIRAFQTFGWDDASTQGNDRTFVHAASGVMVQYESPYLAIQYSGERLTEALGDLFLVLSSLGWKLAEVYHPLATINDLLTDMGRSIRTSLDFDLRAARDIEDVSASPEGASLVARGMALMGGTEAPIDEMMSDFEDLERGGFASTPTEYTMPLASEPSGPIFLDDDAYAGGGRDTHPADNLDVGFNATEGVNFPGFDDETPRIFYAPGSPEAIAQQHAQSAVPTAPQRPRQVQQGGAVPPVVATAESELEVARTTGLPAAPEKLEVPASMAAPVASPVQHDQSVHETRPVAIPTVNRTMPRVVKVGVSTFCFVRPGDACAPDDVASVASECGAYEVIQLRPGELNQPVRWDVLGEIASQPYLADKLAGLLSGSDGASNALLAQVMIMLRSQDEHAQLRSVVSTFLNGECADVHAWFNSENGRNVVRGAVDKFMSTFVALALAKADATFVDAGPQNDCEVFTVMGVMKAARSRLYVVQQDALDSPVWVSVFDALEKLVNCYAQSRRFAEVIAMSKAAAEAEMKRESAIKAANERLVETLQQLRELGVGLPVG